MNNDSEIKRSKSRSALSRQVRDKAARKIRSQRKIAPILWFGLGMMGLIGWSVAVPALLGAALGIWLDKNHPGRYSWTLMLLIAGLTVGCLIAWHWVAREYREMREDQEGNDE